MTHLLVHLYRWTCPITSSPRPTPADAFQPRVQVHLLTSNESAPRRITLASLERCRTCCETSEYSSITVVTDGQTGACQGTPRRRPPVSYSPAGIGNRYRYPASHSIVVSGIGAKSGIVRALIMSLIDLGLFLSGFRIMLYMVPMCLSSKSLCERVLKISKTE